MWTTRIASLLPFLLLLLVTVLEHGSLVEGSPYPRPFPQTVRRLPRRNDFVAYNLHRIIRPRDVNDLGVDQARKAMHDVHETIAEVQRLLALDPSLPRLTRGEIEELFENVTREEFSKSLRAGDHTRAQHMRALMLVLPYHANNMSPESLQQIYTRPPVTRIIGAAEQGQQAPVALPSIATTTTTTSTVPPPDTTTATIPVTTIRFTTPRPTTFHPSLPERMRNPSAGAPLRAEELNDILSAIGLSQGPPPSFRPMPPTTTTTSTTTEPTISNSINVDDPKVAQELKDLLRSFGLLKEPNDDRQNSEGPPPGVELLADIQPSALVLHEPLRVEESSPMIEEPTTTTTTTTVKPVAVGLTQASIKADDYIAFKPLPVVDEGSEQKARDEEMDQLLRSFGLLSPGRSKKSMQRAEVASPATPPPAMRTMPAIDADLVAPQLMSVLSTLGIHTRNGAGPSELVPRRQKTGRKLDPPSGLANDDRFQSHKPSARFRVNNEDYRKLEQLWQTVKELEKLNVNLTDESLDVLNPKHYDLSPGLLAHGPDPLDGVDANEERLNEIKKRQQPIPDEATETTTVATDDAPVRFSLELDASTNNGTGTEATVASSSERETGTTAASSTTTSASSSSSSTTTESGRNAALKDSFPSADLAGDPVNEEPLPPPRRNGFYFLYDWNSFLEVGEDPNKVIIRYNPQAGDPSRFLPVTVP